MLRFRPDTIDVANIIQVFHKKQYACLENILDVKTVVDLGAYVGYSAYYLKTLYPKAFLVALEPYVKSYKMCVDNLSVFPDCKVILGAAWPTCTTLRIVLPKEKYHDTSVRVTSVDVKDEHCVKSFTIPMIMDMFNFERIDILKIDIENAERALFSKNVGWLDKVNNIVIELHNKIARETFFKTMSLYNYDLYVRGELTMCRNIRR